VKFGESIWHTDFSYPMAMYEDWHETGTKSFLNFNIPAGQKGMKDIEMAVEHIFRHPNVGPFIGKQLIQKLVTSNPSPAYIEKIAETFNDNGKGVRGDMAAVFKAILLHPEARSCESLRAPTQGKLQEPLVRLIERIRNYKLIPDANNKIFTDGGDSRWRFDQNILTAPNVFNFYLPNYSPLGELRSNNLLGPEFQMHNSTSSVRWANSAMSPDWLMNYPYANDPEALINQFDKRFTRGQLTLRTRRLMKYNMERNLNTKNRIHSSLGILLLSPEYNILK
jgi:uncharacterized protein (DUF1800 family)